MQPPVAPCGSAIQRFPLIPYLRATGYQPPDLAPMYSARSVRSSSFSLNLNGSSSVPMMMSGPAPTLAATADFGRMSSQLSASTRTLTPVCSVNFLVLATKLSKSAWMNCFQRKTRIEAPDSGAGPFQVGSARATPPGRSSKPAALPDCKTRRLVMSTMWSSLAGARKRFFGSSLHRVATGAKASCWLRSRRGSRAKPSLPASQESDAGGDGYGFATAPGEGYALTKPSRLG